MTEFGRWNRVVNVGRIHGRSLRPMVWRHLLTVAPAVFGVMLFADWDVTLVLLVYAGILAFTLPLFSITVVGRERGQGTLAFLANLPISGRDLATGRILALGEGCALVGGLGALGGGLLLREDTTPTALLGIVPGLFLGATVASLAMSVFVTWLALRHQPDRVVVGTIAVLFCLAFALDSVGVSIAGVLRELVLSERTTLAVSLGTGLTVSQLLLGMLLLSRELEHYVRDPSLARVDVD